MGEFTELSFPSEGHQWYGHEQSELKVKFMVVGHEKFKRFGQDLIYFHKISLIDALKCTPITFTNIDNEQLQVAMDEIISPHSVKVLEGKGMPVLNDNPLGPLKREYARGHLYVRFEI
mmetsp:Transcript_17316/g.16524  ORF Transcript_17316/g.16524 Transcript_17316/m.16524 type:complete len:118 (-) Transcript_17316:95-448(-)